MSDLDIERAAMELIEAALELPKAERLAWIQEQCADADELRKIALQLYSALDTSTAQFRTGGADEAGDLLQLPERVGAYRSVAILGEGGMGAVFLAQRDTGDFDHEVAIKIIKPGLLTDELILRFERERQILASLAHPDIARLYDGGTTDMGEPFIVMEYIDGVPITKWCDEQGLRRNERLTMMIRVCRAVGFAHQNLIVHRDLTPNNVLVNKEGEPKLIDFGIAKPQSSDEGRADETSTRNSRLSLTPGFAAPERYDGAPATTLTDIYSLGKLLERLCESDGSDREIAAIVATATALDPVDRYQSAGTLAEDMERVLENRPVGALGDSRLYALRKFLVRQKFAVTAGAVIVFLMVAGLTATSIGFQRARVAQGEAERRFGEVRAIANTLLFDVYDEVDAVPGSTAARQLLASTAQRYLDALANGPDAPFEIRLEAGRGYMRLADVMGGVGGGNLGLREEATANYERADTILTQLHEERPANEEVALALADLRYARSNVMVHIEEDMDRGLAIAKTIPDIIARGCHSGDACSLRLAQGEVAEGQNQYWLENFDEAVASFDRAIALLRGMAPDSRREETTVRLAALSYRLKGDAVYYQDDIENSVENYDVAVNLLENAMERGLDDPDIRRDLAITHWTRGGSLDELGRTPAAIAALDQAYAIMEELVEADPEDAGSRRLLAVVGGQRGLTLSSAGRYADAIEAAEASLGIRRRLSAMQPDQSGFFRDVAIQLNGLGDIHARAGNRVQACRYYRATVQQFDRLDRRWAMSDFDRNDTYARANEALAGCS